MGVEIQNWFDRIEGAKKRPLRKLARDTMNALLQRYKLPENSSVGATFIDDAGMIELNRDHMGKEEPTDVLSFPIWNDMPPAGEPAPHLGDVVVDVEQAARQAAERGHALNDELRLLLVHGFLHLLGWDDSTPQARKKMNDETRAALRDLNAPQVI